MNNYHEEEDLELAAEEGARKKMFEQARKLKGATPERKNGEDGAGGGFIATTPTSVEIDEVFKDKPTVGSEVAPKGAGNIRYFSPNPTPGMAKNAPISPVQPSLPPTPMPLVESPFVVWTELEKDGYMWNITFRKGTTLSEIVNVYNLADEAQKIAIARGFKPHIKKNGFPKKEVEYVEGRVCPKDGGKLTVGTGKVKEKCENNKWSVVEKKNIGSCSYVRWND